MDLDTQKIAYAPLVIVHCHLGLDQFHNLMEARKKNSEERIKQLKNQALKDIKNASVKVAIESVEKLIKNSMDKSKLDKIYSSSIEETKLALKKKSS